MRVGVGVDAGVLSQLICVLSFSLLYGRSRVGVEGGTLQVIVVVNDVIIVSIRYVFLSFVMYLLSMLSFVLLSLSLVL